MKSQAAKPGKSTSPGPRFKVGVGVLKHVLSQVLQVASCQRNNEVADIFEQAGDKGTAPSERLHALTPPRRIRVLRGGCHLSASGIQKLAENLHDTVQAEILKLEGLHECDAILVRSSTSLYPTPRCAL